MKKVKEFTIRLCLWLKSGKGCRRCCLFCRWFNECKDYFEIK